MRIIWLLLATLMSAFCVGPLQSRAEEAESATPEAGLSVAEDRLQDFESRLAMLESQQARNSAISSRRLFNAVGQSSWYAGYELALLNANVGALSVSLGPGTARITEPFDFEVSPRIFAGYESARGLGFRTTYWQFDHNSPATPVGIQSGLEMHALDMEGTMHTAFHCADIMLSGGLRYAKQHLDAGIAGLGSIAFESEGLGPTFAAQFRRNLWSNRWSLYAGGRASILLTDSDAFIPGLITIEAEETSMQILEMRSGLEYRRCFNGYELQTQIGGEVQNWQAGAIAGIIAPTVALYGPTFRIGVAY